MADRVAEEEKRVVDDICCTMSYLSDVFTSLSSSFTASTSLVERAQLLAKLIHLYKHYIIDLWQIASKHVPNVPPMPEYPVIALDLQDADTAERTDDAANNYIDLDYDTDSDEDSIDDGIDD